MIGAFNVVSHIYEPQEQEVTRMIALEWSGQGGTSGQDSDAYDEDRCGYGRLANGKFMIVSTGVPELHVC